MAVRERLDATKENVGETQKYEGWYKSLDVQNCLKNFEQFFLKVVLTIEQEMACVCVCA